jgi:glucosylceramidase
VAFHPYWGDPRVMRDAYEQTGESVHMTETSDLSPATMLDYFRLDASSYVLWAQTTDQTGGTLHWTPARDNDIDWAEVGRTTKWPNRLVTVDTTTRRFTVRDELYRIGQFARYLSPAHVRVQSSATANGIGNVVFRTASRDYVAVVGNGNDADATVRVLLGGDSFVQTVPARSYATLRWRAGPPRGRNRAPVLRDVPDVVVDQYGAAQVRLTATDADRDRLGFYAVDLPDGVSVDGVTGVVTLRPTVAGAQELRFAVTDGRASDEATVRVTVRPRGAPIGARVEAEAYVAQHGWTEGVNFVENTPSASGGRNIGWTAAGNWLQYRVDVAAADTYDLELRVANGTGTAAPDAVSLRDADGRVLATVSVPDTGGWASYQSVHVPVPLAAGDQLVTVYCETGGFNLDYLRLTA